MLLSYIVRKPSEFFKLPPLTGILENHILFVYMHGGGRLGIVDIEKNFLCFNPTYHVTFYVQFLYKSSTIAKLIRPVKKGNSINYLICFGSGN